MTWSKLLHDPAGFLWDVIRTRGVRLTFYLVLAAVLFPSSRFILLIVFLTILATLWAKDYRKKGSRRLVWLAVAIGALVIGYGIARLNVDRVDQLRLMKTPWGAGINLVQDGTYRGSGNGFRGPIEVEVGVENHRIKSLKTLQYPDAISVEDNEITAFSREILEKGRLEKPAEPGFYRGATITLTGYATAVESALSKGIPHYPRYNLFSTMFFDAFLGSAPTRVTLNALAILFAAFLVFEYALQSMLTPGTGRSINCYNCATCVGACPVKEAEGVQFPMGLVLLTRLGNYERVTELSKYCVGCGRCSAKCPIGNSGPLVIAAAFQACHDLRNEQARQQRDTA